MFSSHTTKIIPADEYAACFFIFGPKELTDKLWFQLQEDSKHAVNPSLR